VPVLGAAQDGFGWTYDHASGAMVWRDMATQVELDAMAGVWRSVAERRGVIGAATAAGTYVADDEYNVAPATGNFGFNLLDFDPADYAIAGKTTTFRLRVGLRVHGTAGPGVTLTFGLYPVSSVQMSGTNLAATLGVVVTNSTCAFVTPASGARTRGVSANFSVGAAGLYAAGVVLSGATAANSQTSFNAILQVMNA
jgi:hypothetical protein